MDTKISDDLAQQLQQAGADEPVSVIVTLRPGVDAAELERHGLQVRWPVESINAVVGTLPAGRASEVSALDGVERIESGGEGEVHHQAGP